ncbi:helix-turn-helix domain-containing protein [Streptomyces sp. NPDC001928]|uniref:helix-turn-helix domain-containing protein n=1 Tax=Streptomyces sp. NPDC001928 TaxID=3154404 RepID=UPI00332C3051
MRYGHLQNPPGPVPDDLISPDMAAAWLGISPRTVRRMVYDGRLAGWYVARFLRVSEAEVRGSLGRAVPKAGAR